MLGTTLVVIGITGLAYKAWDAYMETNDPPRVFSAKVAKRRLDTKKEDGNEAYTYIITFFLHDLDKYANFSVSQKNFDEIMEGDFGVLHCNLERRKFLEWELKSAPSARWEPGTCVGGDAFPRSREQFPGV